MNYSSLINDPELIFIPGNCPSSKNSRRWTGKYSIASKSVFKWKKNTKQCWKDNKDKFLELTKDLPKPLFIGMFFVKGTNHDFDFNNPTQTIQDTMVDEEWITDDNTKVMFPIPFYIEDKLCDANKEYQGTFVKVFKSYPLKHEIK